VDEKKAGIFKADPFQTLDREGVGMLIRWAIERGRATNPKLKIGICGEHGGDAESVKFCYEVGMNYVSASPFRVPISRLAAAQAGHRGKVRRQEEKESRRSKAGRKRRSEAGCRVSSLGSAAALIRGGDNDQGSPDRHAY